MSDPSWWFDRRRGGGGGNSSTLPADVYLAEDTKLGRKVALKVLPPELAENEERRARFVREAKAASAIDHPNVAHIHEIGEADGIHFIAMQFVDGKNLAARVKGDTLATADIIAIGLQVADALDAAHAKRIVHRDIKPANLVLTDRNQIKGLDFGVAKSMATAEASPDSEAAIEVKTVAGVVMGTVHYMSPEQALGRDVDGRSDIFSLGVVLYELTTGRLPFLGGSPTETIERIANAQPEAIARFNYDVPAELERIIRRCLEKDPEERYQMAKDLLIELKHLKRDTESGAVAQPALPSGKRIPWPALALGAAVLAALAGGSLFLSGDSERIDSLAVLPFENGSADPEAEYFSDGVTESIISSLSKLPDVRVISRTSVFRYKGQAIDPETVGRELGVEALVLGRVVQRGDDLAVSAELVRTDGSAQMWGEQYQRKAADIFSIQNDMAREIGDALRIQLTTEQEELLTKQYTGSSDAYEAYLKGRYHWNRRTEEGFRQAIVHFQEAINHDPNYALAHTGLADSLSLLGYYYVSPREAFPRTKQAAKRALELDDSLGEAHVSLAWIKLFYDWDFDEAEREFVRGIELNPTYATGHHWYSDYLVVTERYDEAIERIRMALELEPLSRMINTNYGQYLSVTGRYEEAHEQLRKTSELDPAWAYAHLQVGATYARQGLYSEAVPHYEQALMLDESRYGIGLLGQAYAKSGRVDEAHSVLERLDELAETRYVSPLQRAVVYAGLGDLDRFFEWMERAYEERTGDLVLLRFFRGSRMSNETRDTTTCCAASDSRNRAVLSPTLNASASWRSRSGTPREALKISNLRAKGTHP